MSCFLPVSEPFAAFQGLIVLLLPPHEPPLLLSPLPADTRSFAVCFPTAAASALFELWPGRFHFHTCVGFLWLLQLPPTIQNTHIRLTVENVNFLLE